MYAFLCFIYLFFFKSLHIYFYLFLCTYVYKSGSLHPDCFFWFAVIRSTPAALTRRITRTHSPKYPTSFSEPAEEPPSLCPDRKC